MLVVATARVDESGRVQFARGVFGRHHVSVVMDLWLCSVVLYTPAFEVVLPNVPSFFTPVCHPHARVKWVLLVVEAA